MRRSVPTEDALQSVIRLALDEEDDVVRWRAVHVLGAWPGQESADVVQRCVLGDEDRLVRYGATRSLIDMAAKNEALRAEILSWLTSHLSELPLPADELITEIERALLRRPVPVGWNESVSDLVDELFSSSRDDRERDRWRHLAGRLREAADGEQATAAEAS
jgi:hypothetical protein